MKMFRRISALALVAVLVCLFSASAFAATSFSDLEMYDDGETYVDAYGKVYQDTASGYLSLTAVGLQSHVINITLYFDYKPTATTTSEGHNIVRNTTDTYCSIGPKNGTAIYQMTNAQFIFNAEFSSWIGEKEYTSNSGLLTLD